MFSWLYHARSFQILNDWFADFGNSQFKMANSPPEKRRCMKGGKKVTVEENNEDGDMTEIAKNDGSDIEETSKNDVDNDDSLFLSQALDDEGMKNFFSSFDM